MTPNLPDYVSFLANVVGIPPPGVPAVFPTVDSNATDGDVGFLTDSSETWEVDQWASGYTLLDTTQNLTAPIASNNASTVNFGVLLNTPVLAGDAYIIVPNIAVTSLMIAREIVNDLLCLASPAMYTLAVYNLAADRLINFAQDVQGQTFFQDLRGPTKLNLSRISLGVPSSANDGGTAVGILNPEQMKLFTLSDLQTLKTEQGRIYMGIAQSVGRSIWGLS